MEATPVAPKFRGTSSNIHPHKFALWLGIASMTMFFASITSAFIVKRADYMSWESFKLPEIFAISTVVVVLCSIFLHASFISYKKNKFLLYRVFLALGLVSGLAFLGSQLLGWQELRNIGVFVDGNPSGSFLYFISGAHGLHLIGGVVALLIVFIAALGNRKDPLYELQSVTNPKRLLNLELLVTYWHYIDLVWIYLFIFFKVNYL